MAEKFWLTLKATLIVSYINAPATGLTLHNYHWLKIG